MISGETVADVGLDLRKARKMMVGSGAQSSADDVGANLESQMEASNQGPGSAVGGTVVGAKEEKATSMSYMRPAGIDAPVVKADASTARKSKKRSRDLTESLKSDEPSKVNPNVTVSSQGDGHRRKHRKK